MRDCVCLVSTRVLIAMEVVFFIYSKNQGEESLIRLHSKTCCLWVGRRQETENKEGYKERKKTGAKRTK
jgi:hypothetical protein